MTPNLRAAFSGQRRNVPLARNAIAGFARLCGFSPEEIDDIRIASGEALSNAVEHGQTLRSSGFSVRCTFAEDELTIEIRDNGDGFDGVPEGGYGMLLMRRLMDRVTYEANGTCVRLIRHKVIS